MRNGFVDFLKLCFSVIVCFYHFYDVVSPNPWLPRGDLAVELFVLIAGVYLFASLEREKQEPYAFLKKRFLRFLPYALFGFLLALAVKIYLEGCNGEAVTAKLLGKWLSDGIWDVLMIKMNGMNQNMRLLNAPAWTLSAMLISEFLICACMYNREKTFVTLVVPVSILIGLGIWRHIPRAEHELWIGFTTFGLLRVWIVYCLSWYGCRAMDRIRQAKWTKTGVAVITVCEAVCYAGALWIIMTQTSRNYRWIAVLLMLAGVAVSVSGRSFSGSLFTNAALNRWFRKLSLGIYLTHYPVMQLFRAWFPGEQVLGQVLRFSVSVFLMAVLFSILVENTCGGFRKLCQWVGRKLVEES